jgi:hypothetical protein
MEKQISYYKDLVAKMQQEITLLNQLGEEESVQTEAIKATAKSDEDSPEAVSDLLRQVGAEIDRKARRNFRIYADQQRPMGIVTRRS